MASVERPPPAPMSTTPDGTPAIGKAGLDDVPSVSSPADSEKTVIVSKRSTRAPPHLRRMDAQPGAGAAVFSTDGGRHPHRNPLIPPPPVIVRSDKVRGVVDFANYWRGECPDLYPCFFPDCGWGITDLWDAADIHVESPGFLEEVLHFIVRDNVAGATNFAQIWCQRNQDKVDRLACYTNLMYDANDPFAIVDEFFTEGEQDECPRQFLFHALWALRQGMRSYMSKCHATQSVGSAGPPNKAEPLSPTTNDHAAIAELSKHPPISVRPLSAFSGPPFPTPGPFQSASNGALARQPSFTSLQAPRAFLLEGDAVSMSHQSPMMSGQFAGQPRHTKRRDRSGTNPYGQTQQMPGFVENVRMPSIEHMRHPSGPSMKGAVRGYVPMGPGVINPLHLGARLPPNTSMSSPPMHPVQMEHMQMPPRAALFSPPGPLPAQLYDPAYQQYAPGPFMDMSNSFQYAPIRSADARGMQRSNSQSLKTSGLFNPYGAERPDKAGFATTGSRKGGRVNYPNNPGRGRKYSAGTFDRSLYGSYPSDPPEHVTRYGSGQFNEAPQVRQFSHPTETDMNIINDKQFGCNYDFIGPQNNTVHQLYVKNLPKDVQSQELENLFLERTGIKPAEVAVKLGGDHKDFVHAFVIFDTVDNARKAFDVKNLKLRDRELHVSVARRYFQVGMASQQHLRGAIQDSRRPADSNSLPAKSTQYSPQDARSDLYRVNKQQQSEHPATRGSPEARKAKKNVLAKKTQTGREDQQTEVAKVAASSTNVDPTVKADDSPKHDEPLAQDKRNDLRATMAITETVEETTIDTTSEAPENAAQEAPTNAAQEAPINAVIMETVAKDGLIEAFEAHQAAPHDTVQSDPESISESTPADSQGPLLSSPTEVTLPPAEQVEISHKGCVIISSVAEDPQAPDIALAFSAQEEAQSDDDQKNDLSFHSAQESQPDGDDEAQKGPGASATAVEKERLTEVALKGTEYPVQHHELESAQPRDEHDAAKLGVTILQGPLIEDIIPASGTVLVETGKKQGAKQIESLNPYSKTSRALQKKEKQAKKKEKLREKKGKGKVDVISKTETYAEDMSAKAKGDALGINVTKEGPAQDEQSDKQSGKQSRRASYVVPTQNLEAQQYVEVQGTGKAMMDHVGSPPTAQCAETVDTQANGAARTAAPYLQPAAPQYAPKQVQGPDKKRKIAPAQIAVPKLDFLNRKGSPTSAATPPDTAFFSVSSPIWEEEVELRTCNKASQSPQEVGVPPEIVAPHDSASIASSTTLRGPSPPPMTLSPTANEFHTPLQTPTALGMAPAETAKKNKKKKKSKKKSGNTVSTESLGEEPFHDQLSHIANTQTGYYALRGSDLPAQEVLERGEDKGPKGLIRQVHAYVKGKAASYARVPESTWSKDNRTEVEKMTPEESEHIMRGVAIPVSRGMRYYVDKCVSNGNPPERAGNVALFGE